MGALQKNAFLIVGRMLATMVVQGGEIPRLFSASICQYIQCGFDNCFPTIDEVPDKTVRDSLNRVCNYAFPLMVLVDKLNSYLAALGLAMQLNGLITKMLV